MGQYLWSLELHRKLLSDSGRNLAFKKALKKVVTKDTIVVDIGAGTGFLSFTASRLGAKKCYLYEGFVGHIYLLTLCQSVYLFYIYLHQANFSPRDTEVLKLAKEIATKNKITNCTFIGKHSSLVKTSEIEKADIVISETLGTIALEENIIGVMQDAVRFVKKGGVLIPGKLKQFVSPVIGDTCYKSLNIGWDKLYTEHGLDYSEVKKLSLGNFFQRLVPVEDLWMEGQKAILWDEIDFTTVNFASTHTKENNIRTSKVQWPIYGVAKSATVYGFCLWWTAELVPGVELSTSPLSSPTHWEQAYLPLVNPIECQNNDILSLVLQLDGSQFNKFGMDFRWHVTLNRQEKETYSHQNKKLKDMSIK